MNKVNPGWKIFKNDEKRKRKELEKNFGSFDFEYKSICKRYNICLEPRIKTTGPAEEINLYLAVIHLEDQKV